MCGIVGIASNKNCIDSLLTGLKNLEYRGYDSSGLATYNNGLINHQKSVGKISNLIKEVKTKNIQSDIAIAHTRWATHGTPSLKNAHPFVKDNCAIVHNGIVENFEELANLFSIKKENIKSDTDTEIVAEIFNNLLPKYNNPIKALVEIINKIEGTFSFAILVKGSKSIYATRKGSPLLLGLSSDQNSLSSDVLGLPEDTKDIIFLEDNDIVEINRSKFFIFDKKGNQINREKHSNQSTKEFINRGNYKHFMQKEIFYQPTSIQDTVLNFSDKKTSSFFLPKCKIDFNKIKNLYFAACGTAHHACMISKYWLEELAQISSSANIGSEFRYMSNNFISDSIGVVVSQSGETMDTLECLKKFKQNELYTISIVNMLNSSIARESDYILPTLAGPEMGVASTKAFTSQLTVLALLTLHIQKNKKISNKKDKEIFESLFNLSELINLILSDINPFKKISNLIKDAKSIFYIGRGTMYPLALEGALKLKEITYKHCEGYAAGELKHGPLALIEKNIPVIALAPYNDNFKKILSNVQEIKARDGRVIMITDEQGAEKSQKICDNTLIMPKSNLITAPILYSIPIQLIAYYLAVILGTDVDQPRNLAKSVTVE